jgi:SAM-dependent methyltransferase
VTRAVDAGHYGPDLAEVHDVGFGEFAEAAAPELVAMLRARGIDRGRVVDLGCGSGIASANFARAGYDVTGIDISPAMIRLAKRRLPGARFRVDSVMDAAIPPCIAVFALGEVFNYALGASEDEGALDALLARVRHALPPGGGLFAFDIALWNERMRVEPRSWYDGDTWLVAVERLLDRRRHELTRTIVTFRRSGGAWRRSDETHTLHLPTRSAIAGQLRRAGFRVTSHGSYESFPLPPDHALFVATPDVRGERQARGSGRSSR